MSQALDGDGLPPGSAGPVAGSPVDPTWLRQPRAPSSAASPNVPESAQYRFKRRVLGPPLVSEDLHGQRLGRPTALAVLSSDVMSSSAYATESMLRILVPAVGVAAFALITPATGLLLLLLGVVCLCYRQVVKAYPVSGGSYVVSRENFGRTVAQIPGSALLLSYVLTVAVSVAAGVDAVISAVPVLSPYPVELAVAFVLLLAYGNLRGIREAGTIFAIPTYWFFVSMAALVDRRHRAPHRRRAPAPGPAQRTGPHRRRLARHRAAPRVHGLHLPAGLRQRRLGHDRHGGHLERRHRVPRAPGEATPGRPWS